MTVYALYFCLVVALALFYCLTRCFKAIVKELERQAQGIEVVGVE